MAIKPSLFGFDRHETLAIFTIAINEKLCYKIILAGIAREHLDIIFFNFKRLCTFEKHLDYSGIKAVFKNRY